MLERDFKIFALLIIIIAICLPIWLNNDVRRTVVDQFTWNFLRSATQRYFVVLGVVSARYNFEKRETIRKTWLRSYQKRNRNDVLIKFVLTSQDCDIPSLYRRDVHECVDENVSFSDLGRTNLYSSYSSLKQGRSVKFPISYTHIGVDFRTTFDVITKSLIVPMQSSDRLDDLNVRVSLVDLGNNNSIVFSKTVSVSDLRKLGDDSMFVIDVPSFLLPKGFQGSLIIQCPSYSRSASYLPCMGVESHFDLQRSVPGLIYNRYIRYSEDEEFPDFIDKRYQTNVSVVLPIALVYDIDNLTKSRRHLLEREAAFDVWKNENDKNKLKLTSEINKYADIVFVDDDTTSDFNDGNGELIDVYRNLSKKLLLFYKWSFENLVFEFIGKIDDDCYLDIDKLLSEVQGNSYSAFSNQFFWFGNFRLNWPVDRWGKWREEDYPSLYYPPFACGSGNVLSRNLVKWISFNSQNLHHYQGEDVSMGIWLSPLNPVLVDSSLWICDNSCHSKMIVSAQNNKSQLQELWKNKENCGNPCSCEVH